MHGIWPVSYMIWAALTALLALATLGSIVKLALMGEQSKTALELMDTVNVRCISCGWKGEVPRVRKRCPMCAGDSFE